MTPEGPAYSVVRLTGGEVDGLPLLLMYITDDDVQEARDMVRAGDPGHIAILRVLVSFLWALDVDPAAHDWSSGEIAALLETLGMPSFEWSPLEDAELTRLLVEEASRHGQRR